MAYAPILDPLANTRLSPSRRRLALVAGAALQQLVIHDELATALRRLEVLYDLADTDAHGSAAMDGSVEALHRELAGLQGVQEVLVKSGIDANDLLPQLVQQLRNVRDFGQLEGAKPGGSRDISGISRLIRSGRIELFAG